MTKTELLQGHHLY